MIGFHLYSPITLDPLFALCVGDLATLNISYCTCSVKRILCLSSHDVGFAVFELRQKRAREGKTDICTIDKGVMDVSKHKGLMSPFLDTFSKLIAKVIYR